LRQPYLIDGYKFDLRLYVLVTSCDPLRIFLFQDGLARFATEKYDLNAPGCMENYCMHLTNYAINKVNPNFFVDEDPESDSGHKRSLKVVYEVIPELK
jgi:hypothetical protein